MERQTTSPDPFPMNGEGETEWIPAGKRAQHVVPLKDTSLDETEGESDERSA